MIALNIDANTQEQRILKSYLEQNASEALAEKINNGVPIIKDKIPLINKKTLNGFMTFACDEAKKLAEKGARGACIEDKTVFGWAIHYFEEDSIEGTLYNLDGSEYKQPKPKYEPKAKSPIALPKPKEQLSLFDFMDTNETNSTDNSNDSETDEILTEEEMRKFDGDMEEPKDIMETVFKAEPTAVDDTIIYKLFEILGNILIAR